MSTGITTPEDGGLAFQSLTLRDYFAAKMIQGWIASMSEDAVINNAVIAAGCYSIADAMLEERAK